MRLTREKIVRLSHKMMDVLVASSEVEFIEDRDTIRQNIVTILTNQLREEEKWDAGSAVQQAPTTCGATQELWHVVLRAVPQAT